MFVYTCTVFSFWGNGFSPKMFPHTNLLGNNNTSISFIDQQGDFAEDSLTNHGPILEDPWASRGDYDVDTPTSLKYVCCLTSNKRKCQGKSKKSIEYWPKSRIYSKFPDLQLHMMNCHQATILSPWPQKKLYAMAWVQSFFHCKISYCCGLPKAWYYIAAIFLWQKACYCWRRIICVLLSTYHVAH